MDDRLMRDLYAGVSLDRQSVICPLVVQHGGAGAQDNYSCKEDLMATILSPVTLDEQAVATFRAQLRGELVRPGDADYDDARRVYNGMIDKRPALIARCTDVAD